MVDIRTIIRKELNVSIVVAMIFPEKELKKGNSGLMDKVSVSQPWDRWFEPHMGHDHDTSYDTSTG